MLISLNNTRLQAEKVDKYLGVVIDSELKFKEQINDMIKKVTYTNYIFKRIRYYMNDYTALTVLKTMLLPLVDHGNIFITGCNADGLQQLRVQYNNAIRIALEIRNPRDISTTDLFTTAKVQ